jgi:hypothetical protein
MGSRRRADEPPVAEPDSLSNVAAAEVPASQVRRHRPLDRGIDRIVLLARLQAVDDERQYRCREFIPSDRLGIRGVIVETRLRARSSAAGLTEARWH